MAIKRRRRRMVMRAISSGKSRRTKRRMARARMNIVAQRGSKTTKRWTRKRMLVRKSVWMRRKN